MGAALNWVFGATSAFVLPLDRLYGIDKQSNLALNAINYSYYYVYAAVGLLVPWFVAQTRRGPLLAGCVWLSFMATAVQCLFASGFEVILVASFVVSVPQPIIVSSLAVILKEYVPEAYESRALSVYTTITNCAAGAGYLAAVWFLPDESISQVDIETIETVLVGLIMPGLALLAASLIAVIAYLWLEPEESCKPLISEAPDDDAGPGAGTMGDVVIMWLMLLSCSLQEGVGNALGLMFGQISHAYGLSRIDIMSMMVVVAIASMAAPLAVGWIMDATHSFYGLPFALVVLQALSQIGIFYWAPTGMAVIGWIVLFSIPNGALSTVFLPALVHMRSGYSRSEINSAMRWFIAVWSALSSLILLRVRSARDDDALFHSLAPLFLTVGIATSVAVAVAFVLSRKKPSQSPDVENAVEIR
jgi:predicted MFS family arabinose efflux permease